MADENPSTEIPPQDNVINVNLGASGIPTSYANTSHISVNASDVTIYFGLRADAIVEKDIRFESRVIVSHDSFIKMVEFWATRYYLLKKLYGGNPMSLDDFDRSAVDEAFQEMLSPQAPQQEGEDE